MEITGWHYAMVGTMVVAVAAIVVIYRSQFCRDYQFRHAFGINPAGDPAEVQELVRERLWGEGRRIAELHVWIRALEAEAESVSDHHHAYSTEQYDDLQLSVFLQCKDLRQELESAINKIQEMHHAANRVGRGIVIMTDWSAYLPSEVRDQIAP